MSELKARHIVDVYDSYYAENPFGELSQVYLKSEADKVIAELEESHKMEVEQLLIEIVKLKNIDSKNRSAYYKDLAMMAKDVEHHKYKRCLAMAEMCKARYDEEDAKVNGSGASWEYINKEMKHWERWQWRWESLAEKFKEAK